MHPRTLTAMELLNGLGELDGDDIFLLLDVLSDKWESWSYDCKPHAEHLMNEAHEAMRAAWKAVDAALQEEAADKTSDEEDFVKQDNKARAYNIKEAA